MQALHTGTAGDTQDGDKYEVYLQQVNMCIARLPVNETLSKSIQAFNYWLKIGQDKVFAVEDLMQTLHKHNLLFVQLLYTPQAEAAEGDPVRELTDLVSAYTKLRMVVLDKVRSLQESEITKRYIDYMCRVRRGFGMEIYWRDNYICPAFDEYCHIAERKSEALHSFAFQLLQFFSNNRTDYSKLLDILTVYWQIREDYCSLFVDQDSEKREFCRDIADGRFSLPIIHAVQKQPLRGKVAQIMKKRSADVEVKKYCVKLLEEMGSRDYTRRTLEALDKNARKEIERLGGNPLLEDLLDELMYWREENNVSNRCK